VNKPVRVVAIGAALVSWIMEMPHSGVSPCHLKISHWRKSADLRADMSILALREARRHVYSFTDESEVMADHGEAIECLDCEAVLQLGIDAFHWLIMADETLRRAVYAGAPADPDAQQTLEMLFRAWLKPCRPVKAWIAIHKERGYKLANLEKFETAEREVLAIVKALDADQLTDAIRDLRDSAVTEHRNGETAEFV
jgi:hypothetical protein